MTVYLYATSETERWRTKSNVTCIFELHENSRTIRLRRDAKKNLSERERECLWGTTDGKQNDERQSTILRRVCCRTGKNVYCPKAKTQVGTSGTKLHVDHSGLRIWAPKIDGCLQKVVSASLRGVIPHEELYPPIAEQSVERRMYDTMQTKFFWQKMGN